VGRIGGNPFGAPLRCKTLGSLKPRNNQRKALVNWEGVNPKGKPPQKANLPKEELKVQKWFKGTQAPKPHQLLTKELGIKKQGKNWKGRFPL